MANEFFLSENDRLPVLRTEVSDDYGAINISGATPVLTYRIKPTGAPQIKTGTIVSSESGVVQYAWVNGDLAQSAVYWARWTVTFSDGKPMTFPNDHYITFEISPDLATLGG